MVLLDEIANGEGKKLEFKREMPSAEIIAKTVSAFANTAGGKLIIGIDDKRNIIGIDGEGIYAVMDKISNILHDMIAPVIIPDIYTYNINGLLVIIVEVFPNLLKPYFLKNKGKSEGTYIRVGATNKKADMDYIQELERQKHNISYDCEAYTEKNVDEINPVLKLILSGRLNREIKDEDLLNLFLNVRLNGIVYPTNGALLLLGVFDKAKIQCACFKGNSTDIFLDKKTFEQDLFLQIEQTMKFLLSHINLASEDGEDFITRKDRFEIPPAALREALVNAVVHRDYAFMNSDIKVAIFDEKIEITSPGTFPKGITVDEAISGRSEIRNRALARIFKEANFIEQWGRGINRIFNLCSLAGLKTPEIIESGMFIQIRIYRTKLEEQDAKTGRKNRTQKQDAKTGHKNRTQYIELIKKSFAESETFTTLDFMNISSLSKSRSSAILSDLVKSGHLKKQGRSRSTCYKIIL